jgi:hypothetical protein
VSESARDEVGATEEEDELRTLRAFHVKGARNERVYDPCMNELKDGRRQRRRPMDPVGNERSDSRELWAMDEGGTTEGNGPE